MSTHPYIPELKELVRKGKVSRREFVQHATTLGMSFGAAMTFLAACAQEPDAQPTVSAPGEPTRPPIQTPAPLAPTPAAALTPGPGRTPVAAQTPAAQIRRGGTLQVAARVMRMDDPARMSWYQPADVVRHVNEYLTEVDQRGIAHPLLLERWEVAEDAQLWTLHVRPGIQWHGMPTPRNVDADDVVFNIQRWLRTETGSSMKGLMGYLQETNVERVDDQTVRLHLDRPSIEVPYAFFHYPAPIVPREFQGDWVRQPWGTGPFELAEYVVGERVRLRRRDGYWKDGADGQPLPYIDEIVKTDFGEEAATAVAAMASGQVDYAGASPATVAALERINAVIHQVPSAATNIFRMRADTEPWNDPRVRMALKLSINREQMIQRAYQFGTLGYDTHSNETQPDFVHPGERRQDIERARQLLAEAGYPDGLEVQLFHKVDPQWEGVACTVLQQQAAPAGFRIQLAPVPSAQYWDQWTNYAFGFTNWAHRPLATMSLALAYSCGASWNETHWCDQEWEAQLADAAGTVDLDERRQKMGPILQYLRDEGPIANPFHIPYLRATSRRTHGFAETPYGYANYKWIWLDQ